MRLIHPECRDPADEFDGWLARLIREGRQADVSDREMAQLLKRAGDELSAGAR